MGAPLSDSAAQMGETLKALEERWQSTGAEWQDVSRADFEKEHLDEIRRVGKAGQRGMSNVSELLRRVIRECS
jgi:hypothetical protein